MPLESRLGLLPEAFWVCSPQLLQLTVQLLECIFARVHTGRDSIFALLVKARVVASIFKQD
jgi:hypothetical protein